MTEFGFIDHIKELFAALPDNGFEGIGDDWRRAPRRGGRIAGLHDRHACRRRPFPAFRNFVPRTGAQIPCRKPERRRFDGRPPWPPASLSLPADTAGTWAEEFMLGYRELSEAFGVTLAGATRPARRQASRSMSRPSAASPTHTSSAAAEHAPATRYSSPENSDFRARTA